MALQLRSGLQGAAVMVILMVLGAPVAEGRDSPRKCRVAASGNPLWGEGLPWAGVWGRVVSMSLARPPHCKNIASPTWVQAWGVLQ